jgi:hypothetical protein
MAESLIALASLNGTTIQHSHGISSTTSVSTGSINYNFDSTTQTYRTTSWDACNIANSQDPNTSTSTRRHLSRVNYHQTSNQTRINVYTSNISSGSFYGSFQNPIRPVVFCTSGQTDVIGEGLVIAAARYNSSFTMSSWNTGISSTSSQGTGIGRFTWSQSVQDIYSSNTIYMPVIWQSYLSGGVNTVDLCYARTATYVDIRSINSTGGTANPSNGSLMAFRCI